MFRNQTDRNEVDRPCYSESIDCLLDMARIRMTAGENLLQQEIQDRWQEISGSGNLESDLESGLRILAQEAARARDYLKGDATLSIDPDMPDDIPGALEVLNDVAILSLVLKSLPDKENRIPPNINYNAELLYLELSAGGVLPYHRLIPVNSWRRSTRDALPLEYAPYFPWYDAWTAVPDNLLDRIVENWPGMYGENPDFSCLEIDEGLAGRLLATIRKDTRLYHFLEERAKLWQRASDELARHTWLRLAALAGTVSGTQDTPLPGPVARKGFQAVARRVVGTRIFSEQEKHELMLLAALYGPELDSSMRMELFRAIGEWLDAGPDITTGSLSWELAQWRKNALYAPELIGACMQVWLEKLEYHARKITAPEPYRARAFAEAVQGLRSSEPVSLFKEVGDRLVAFAEKLNIGFPGSLPASAGQFYDWMLDGLFPAPLLLGAADSCGVKCVAVTWNGRGAECNELNTEEIEIEKVQGETDMWKWSGKVILPTGERHPEEYVGSLYRGNRLVKHSMAFEIDSNDKGINFSALFRLDGGTRPEEFELRIILVFKK